MSVAAAVGGSGHDNCPGRRRTVARGDAVPGELGSQTRAPATTRTDHQLEPIRDSQLRGDLDSGRAALPPRPQDRDRAGRFRQVAQDRDELDCSVGCERLAEVLPGPSTMVSGWAAAT